MNERHSFIMVVLQITLKKIIMI